MPLNVINNSVDSLTKGEEKILDKLKNIYKAISNDAYLYIQPKLNNLIPDFILIDRVKGICVLEVKDWSLDYIRSIDKRKVYLQDRIDDNPVFKTSKYVDLVNGFFASNDDLEFDSDMVFGRTVLPNISSEDFLKIENELTKNNIECILKDHFTKLSIDKIFCEEDFNLSYDELTTIRTVLFPEIKIHSQEDSNEDLDEIIKALDIEQENFAKRVSYGHYMVTGVPGSGKSVILLARAIHLVRENPEWKVKIVTYNKSLASKIQHSVDLVSKEINKNSLFYNINISNIEVEHFHKMANRVYNGVIDKDDKDWWSETLPNLALKKAVPTYDAILIDEYQDFRDSWIHLCIKLCREYTYTNNSNEEVKGINLFLAGDRLQSIYNSKVHNWSKDFGINMSGRSKLLKTSYRSGKANTTLALKFLQENEDLIKEVNNFYKDNDKFSIRVRENDKSSIEFIDGGYDIVCDKVKEILDTTSYTYEDILVVCKSNYSCDKIYDKLASNIKHNSVSPKNSTNKNINKPLIITTYHSSKGLESKVVILVDVDKFTTQLDYEKEIMDRKLLYVGITRSSEKLIIHASNYQDESFATTVKNIYEEANVYSV
ncbi:MAG: AAA family ATPase [Peptostreptococcaceae bacterium]